MLRIGADGDAQTMWRSNGIKWRDGKCRSPAKSNAVCSATKNMRRSVSRTIPPSMTSRRVSLMPCDPACARCTIRSERSADRSDERGAEKPRLAVQKLSRNRRACITTQASLRRGAEAGEQGAQASSQPGSSDRTCRSDSKGSRAASGSELHDLSPRRSHRERRHGAESEHTPKKDHCRRKNRTSVAGDESRSGGARCARCMSLADHVCVIDC